MFIIAEAGVNHNGDVALALKMVDAAVLAGVDAIKFQTFSSEKLVAVQAPKADYQKLNTSGEESQIDMLKKLELTYDDFRLLKDTCDQKGILFLSTPFDESSADFLEPMVPFYKISSGEVTNLPFLRHVAQKKKPMILSTGMCTLSDVETALGTIREIDPLLQVTLLHCTTNYPCAMEEVNLNAMLTLNNAFKLPVGYSDHTLGWVVPVAAAALGAKIIEKHFTLDKNMTGPDHQASLEPDELAQMVVALRQTEKALGDGIKRPNASEEAIKKAARKVIVSVGPLEAGHVVTAGDLVMKRAGTGIEAKYMELLIGKKMAKNIGADEPLQWQCFFIE